MRCSNASLAKWIQGTSPNPAKYQKTFKRWLVAVNNKQLMTLPENYVFEHYRVCSKHFVQNDIGTNNKLKKGSVPQLFLPGICY